jgi:hypothetical protein
VRIPDIHDSVRKGYRFDGREKGLRPSYGLDHNVRTEAVGVQPAAPAAVRSPRFRGLRGRIHRSPEIVVPLGPWPSGMQRQNRAGRQSVARWFPEDLVGSACDRFPVRDFLSVLGLAHAARLGREKPGRCSPCEPVYGFDFSVRQEV